MVADLAPGTKADLTVWRGGKTKDVTVKVGEVPAEKEGLASAAGEQGGKLGLAVRPLAPDERAKVGQDGLVVERVNGPAAKAGLQPGDVVRAVNGTPVKSADEVKKALGDGKRAALLVQRGDGRMFVPVEIG